MRQPGYELGPVAVGMAGVAIKVRARAGGRARRRAWRGAAWRAGARSGCKLGPAEGMAGTAGPAASMAEPARRVGRGERVGPDEIEKGCAEAKMHRKGHGIPIEIEKMGK